MKNFLLMLCLLLTFFKSFSQECGRAELSPDLKDKKTNDSIYKRGIEQRIDYFAALNRDILPKYLDLKNKILNSIENSDFKDISELRNSYEENRLEFLTEMKDTQTRVYNDLTPYSKIYTILVFETLDAFPNSYAMLFNPTSRIKSRLRGRETIIMNRLYQKYSEKLSEYYPCAQQMKEEMKKAKNEKEIVDINQNLGNKTEEETKKTEVVDLLLWSIK